MIKIGFFGCGNMGEALALGFKNGKLPVEQYFFTPSKTKASHLAQKVGGHLVDSITNMPKDLDWYILAFKPQTLPDFHFLFPSNAKILSVLAGTSIETLLAKFQVKQIARLMPNTPSSIGMGANLFYANFKAGIEDIQQLLSPLGKVFLMKSEEELDAMTAFSGSGPALIFEYARIFEKHLQEMSGDNFQAREIITQTFLGSAKLMEAALMEGISFATLRERVTSKKGVTYEALEVLKKNDLEQTMREAFLAAHKRTLELKQGI